MGRPSNDRHVFAGNCQNDNEEQVLHFSLTLFPIRHLSNMYDVPRYLGLVGFTGPRRSYDLRISMPSMRDLVEPYLKQLLSSLQALFGDAF